MRRRADSTLVNQGIKSDLAQNRKKIKAKQLSRSRKGAKKKEGAAGGAFSADKMVAIEVVFSTRDTVLQPICILGRITNYLNSDGRSLTTVFRKP